MTKTIFDNTVPSLDIKIGTKTESIENKLKKLKTLDLNYWQEPFRRRWYTNLSNISTNIQIF